MSAPSGERHHCAKRNGLTHAKVQDIRAAYADGENLTQRMLAERYGVSHVAIHKIVTRKTWDKR